MFNPQISGINNGIGILDKAAGNIASVNVANRGVMDSPDIRRENNQADKVNTTEEATIAKPAVSEEEIKEINIAEELIDEKIGQYTVEANAASLKTKDDTIGTILDVFV